MAFNPNDKHSYIVLSNGNRTAAQGFFISSHCGVRAVEFKTAGKIYFELHIDQWSTGEITVGWMHGDHSLYHRVGEDSDYEGVGFSTTLARLYRFGAYITVPGYTPAGQDDYVMVAIDFAAGKFWAGVNNVWANGGNPTAGSNPTCSGMELSGQTLYPAVSLYAANDHICTIRQTLADFEGTIPEGFSPVGVGSAIVEAGLTAEIGFGMVADADLTPAPGIVSGIGFGMIADAEFLPSPAAISGIGFGVTADRSVERSRGVTSGFGLGAAMGANIEKSRGVENTLALGVTAGAINYSAWLRENRDHARYRYYTKITGAANGLADFEMPGFKNFQFRMRSGNPSYLSIVLVYSPALLAAISARKNGELVVDMAAVVNGVESLREELIRAPFENIRYDLGPENKSLTIVGYVTRNYGGGRVALAGVTNERMLADGRLQFRCARPDFYLKPGDTAIYGTHEITVAQVSCMVAANSQFMDVSE